MNLRVDLILGEELRSASVVNLKSVLRIVSIVVPVLILIVVLMSMIKLMSLKSELNRLTSEWDAMQVKIGQAQKIGEEVRKNRDIKSELDGWSNSRLVLYQQLMELQKEVPGNMVFESLKYFNTIQPVDNKAARNYTLSIRGSISGENSQDNVLMFKKNLLTKDILAEFIEGVEIPVFKQDESAGAKKEDRIFTMECVYKTRKFE